MSETINTDMEIRPAKIADSASIAKILRATGWFTYLADETPAQTETKIRHHIDLCAADDSHSLVVAESSRDGLLGYASVHWLPYLFLSGPEGYLSELFVDKNLRGRGIGKQLLDTIVKEAKCRGCARLMLVTGQSRESYQRGFYSKAGWTERKGVANFVLKLKE